MDAERVMDTDSVAVVEPVRDTLGERLCVRVVDVVRERVAECDAPTENEADSDTESVAVAESVSEEDWLTLADAVGEPVAVTVAEEVVVWVAVPVAVALPVTVGDMLPDADGDAVADGEGDLVSTNRTITSGMDAPSNRGSADVTRLERVNVKLPRKEVELGAVIDTAAGTVQLAAPMVTGGLRSSTGGSRDAVGSGYTDATTADTVTSSTGASDARSVYVAVVPSRRVRSWG